VTVRVLSAGACKGLVGSLAGGFTVTTGEAIDGFFSAVGAIRERFEGGAPCDVLILTLKQLNELEAEGRVRPGSVAPIGTVRTAVAVPAGHPVPDISTSAAFAATMRAASAVFIPDPFKSTAGIHVLSVLQMLGLADDMASKLRAFPNGETAMHMLAEEAPSGGIGTTQTTEILYTKGLTLVGPLPPVHDLSTVYAACVSATAEAPDAAAAFVTTLTRPENENHRRQSGFE